MSLRVIVVCTGNVARSPALAAILQLRNFSTDFSSAAVGRKALAGLPVKQQMRKILEREGYGDASPHRSRLLTELEWTPDVVVCCAPVHLKRTREILPDVPQLLCQPVIPDPAFGGPEAYEVAWQLMLRASDDIISRIGLLTAGSASES